MAEDLNSLMSEAEERQKLVDSFQVLTVLGKNEYE